MNIRSAIIETRNGRGRFGIDEKCVLGGLSARGLPFVEGTVKQVQRGRIVMAPDVLVVGSIQLVHAALTQLGIPHPVPNDYPPALVHHLHRKVWRSRLGDPRNIGHFVKSVALKRVTGFVLDADPSSYLQTAHLSGSTPVWVAEPVAWLSEWRCFVAEGRLVGIRFCDGDPDAHIDPNIVHQAISEWGDAPGGYALDFGVLSTGETALIEVNNGYSLGSYGLGGVEYLEVLAAFWCSYVQQHVGVL